MTNIFLLLWLADALDTLRSISSSVLVFSGFVVLVGAIMAALAYTIEDWRPPPKTMTYLKPVAAALVVLSCITVVLPKGNLVRLAVAAHAAKVAVNTELGQKVERAVNATLDKLIEKATKE